MFLETSALNGSGVQEIFLKCARTILTKIEQGILNPDASNSGVQHGDSSAAKELVQKKRQEELQQAQAGGCC